VNSALPQQVETRLAEYRAAVEAQLAGIVAGLPGGDPLTAALRYALAGGGKRLRPVLCLAAADAVAGSPGASSAAPAAARARAAAAVELIHTYSLVHDDLPCMDDDSLRRGRPTTHRVYGTETAIAAGFALIPLACRTLAEAGAELRLPSGRVAAAVAELCRGAGAAGMVGGQLLDLEAEGERLQLDELQRIHALKTGALFQAAMRIGGIIGGADGAAVLALGHFGARLGLAFQITDDVLDETTDAEVLGKTPGKDRGADKATFVSLLGLEPARRAAAAEAAAATAGLREAGIASTLLEALAEFAVDRDR
jgi:geranylgeranyl pyrophosphate synthase